MNLKTNLPTNASWQPLMVAALTKSFTPEAVAGVAVDSTDLNADLHASKAYRAHLITVQTQRAVKQANG